MFLFCFTVCFFGFIFFIVRFLFNYLVILLGGRGVVEGDLVFVCMGFIF